MSLSEYKKKRNFKNTPEPSARKGAKSKKLRFVVQRHDASSLHYDLRLEMEGVLKSWAVPKGPSLNPDDKRLAIMTEDHPVKYLTFEGTIPKGNYGAGEMIVWDSGTYNSYEDNPLEEQLMDGNLKIEFTGKHLKGKFALVHTSRGEKQNQWLLIKKKDEYSVDVDYDAENLVKEADKNAKQRKADVQDDRVAVIKLNETVKPMLATLTEKIFDHKDWLFELKWDGYRALASVKNGKVNLYSRNGISFNSKYAALTNALADLPHDVLLDGEIVVVDRNGKAHFQRLQHYDENTPGELRYYVFDLLFLNGHSTTGLKLEERKSLIPEIIEDIDHVFYCDHIKEKGKSFYKKAVEVGAEGVIAKLSDSKYYPGARSEYWLKIKKDESIEALICGYTESDSLAFGSLILGMYQNDTLVYIGNCGTGFSEKERTELLRKLKSLNRKTTPFNEKPNLKGRKPHWVSPKLICEVKFSEWTNDGSLRHPSFKGIRKDKDPEEIGKEQLAHVPVKKSGSSKSEKGNKGHLEVGGIQVPVSNLNKELWPGEGFTKYDLIDYYLHISDVILPYLKDRPQNMHRHPNGIKEQGFYQKDSSSMAPDWAETITLHSKSADKDIEYLLCQNEATLLYMANLACIELNPWNSKKGSLRKPDYTVMDIDPSDKNTFEEVIEVAQAVKEVLDAAKIEGFAKTSGSSGIHVYIPMGAEYGYNEARQFTELLCQLVHEKLPKLTSMERNLKKRGKKIYMDYLQNRKGQTLAAPYSLRPKPGATASAPLKWNEVKSGLDMHDFNIKTMQKRVKKEGDLFKGVLGKGVDIEKVLEGLSG